MMFFHQIAGNSKFLKTRLSKSGCHGNIKSNRQKNFHTKLFPDKFWKKSPSLVALACLKSYKHPKSMWADSLPPQHFKRLITGILKIKIRSG